MKANPRHKILMLSARSSIHTIRWVNAMAKNGHVVGLASMHPGGGDLEPTVEEFLLPYSAPFGYVSNMMALRKIIREFKPDILHTHYASGYGMLGALSGFRPQIVSVWGQDIFNFPLKTPMHKALITNILDRAQWVGSTSEVMAKQTLTVAPNVSHKLTVTPFGVDVDFFCPQPIKDPELIVIGTVKSLYEKYGVDTLIKGFAELKEILEREKSPEAEKLRLVICGEGTDRPQLEKLARARGIDEVTEFKGQIDHHRVPEELNKMDIYVAMSREESFGVAIVEASSCGVPVIVSNCGGLPEVVEDGQTGYVVKDYMPSALTQHLKNLVLDPELRHSMGRRGRKRVCEMYNWTENVKLMESLYSHVLGRQ